MASILIADDVALARDGLARALRERGHRVTVVADGQDAVDRFQRERPELVILDVMMPRLGGLEACARIKSAATAFTPVLIISARTDLDMRLSSLSLAEDFVPKPYEAQEVCARVEAHLRTRRLVEEATAQKAPPGARDEDQSAVPAPAPAGSSGKMQKSGAATARLLDRDAFVERLNDEWRRSQRSTDPITLLVAGVDGPAGAVPPGESIVAILLGAMQRSLRGIDVLARVDEEHAAGLLLKTHITGAMAVATRLRQEIRRTTWPSGASPVVSMGFAFYPNKDVSEPNDLLRVGEKALARAREDGAGRICLWQHQGYLFDPPE